MLIIGVLATLYGTLTHKVNTQPKAQNTTVTSTTTQVTTQTEPTVTSTITRVMTQTEELVRSTFTPVTTQTDEVVGTVVFKTVHSTITDVTSASPTLDAAPQATSRRQITPETH
jgi:hypothetical protein